jgi:hypothetical protein
MSIEQPGSSGLSLIQAILNCGAAVGLWCAAACHLAVRSVVSIGDFYWPACSFVQVATWLSGTLGVVCAARVLFRRVRVFFCGGRVANCAWQSSIFGVRIVFSALILAFCSVPVVGAGQRRKVLKVRHGT